MKLSKQRTPLTASVAGTLAAAGVVGSGQNAQAQEEKTVHCYGINKCKGTGDCGGPGHACAGKNACKGLGWIELEEDVCLRIEGGRLTPEAQ